MLDGGGAHEVLTLRADGVTVRGLTIRNVGVELHRGSGRDPARRRAPLRRRRQPAARHVLRDLRRAGRGLRDRRATGSRATAAGRPPRATPSTCSPPTASPSSRNRIRGHRDGIYLEFSRRATIVGNDSRGNLRYGLHFMYSDSCEYRRNVFAANGAGVAVMYSRSVTMADNRFEDNSGPAAYGLLLKEIKDSRIEGNVLARNTVGLFAEGADRDRGRGQPVPAATAGRSGSWPTRPTTASATTGSRGTRSTWRPTARPAARAPSPRTTGTRYVGYDLDRDGFGDVPFRPVRLFSVLVEQNEPLLILLRSFFLDLLEAAERVDARLTPEALVDAQPADAMEGLVTALASAQPARAARARWCRPRASPSGSAGVPGAPGRRPRRSGRDA